MHGEHGRIIDISTLDTFDDLVARGAASMRGWRVQDLDLRSREDALDRLDGAGGVLLGCDLTDASDAHLRATGAIVFADVPDLPFNAYRASLYTPDELSAGIDAESASTYDARVYAWSRSRDRDVARTLAAAMHDHSIDDALRDWVHGRRIVGVMGGHGIERGTDDYRLAAELGRALALAGLTVATGGGPGAMEAANLGARSADSPAEALDAALEVVARVPSFARDAEAWMRTGAEAAALLTPPRATLGIPTWHYGHEPPNMAATAVAKYFQNAVREDILLRVANAGIVVLPGAGGTVQEIFQDACENSYAAEGAWAPMVLVGREHWSVRLPAWQLLQALMAGLPGERGLALVDSPADAVAAITRHVQAGD